MIIKATDSTFKTLISEHSKALIKFGATWCGPCKLADKILEQVSADHPEAIIITVDVEECPQAATALGISNVPHNILSVNGNVEWAASGVQTKTKYLELLAS